MNLAFCIGCSGYEEPVPRLRYAARDAQRFADVMSGTCGLRDEEIVVFGDGDASQRAPTYTSVLRSLSRGSSVLNEGVTVDILYFFFSGHGYHSPSTGQDYLLLADSVPGNFDRTSLSMTEVVDSLLGWKPRQLVLFIDACREPFGDAKALVGEGGLPTPDVTALLPSGHVTFCSCSRDERSYEAEQIQSGIFTHALCEALSDRGRCRTLNELNAYLLRRVPELSATLGKPRQMPVTRLEPAEILHLEIVSAEKRNLWRSHVPVRDEIRPSGVPRPSPRPSASALGVDFGTCNSLVAFWNGTEPPRPVPDVEGNYLVPSVVNLDPELNYYVGSSAIDRESLGRGVTVRYVKRNLGTAHEYNVYGHSLSPEFITSLMLRSLRQNAAEYLHDVPRPVVGYPESFTIAQFNALAEAFELAQWPPLRMVSEPSAAGLVVPRDGFEDWGANQDTDTTLALIIDLGGGTLDVALISGSIHEDGFVFLQVHGTSGDGRLGGIDYDAAMVDLIADRFRTRLGDVLSTPRMQSQLRSEAERAKCALSFENACLVLLRQAPGPLGRVEDVAITVTRAEYALVTAGLDARVRRAIEAVFLQTGFPLRGVEKVDKWGSTRLTQVLLAGMGARLPSVHALLRQFTDAPIVEDHDDDAVGEGLARQAAIITGSTRDVLLVDAAHRGVGILVQGSTAEAGYAPEDQLWLSGNDAENQRVVLLLRAGDATPTKRSELVTLQSGPASVHRLRLVELRDGHHTPIGVLEIDSLGDETDVLVTLDVDAGNLMTLTVTDRTHGGDRVVLLNYRDRSVGEPIRDQRLTGSLLETPSPDSLAT